MQEFVMKYGFLLLVFPLLGAFLNGIFGRYILRRYGEAPIGLLACASVFMSFVLSIAVFLALNDSENGSRIICNAYTWLNAGNLRADAAFLFDPLSSIMILVVTGVGLLIHIYSLGYMKGDSGYYRFFAYLNLFIFSMLLLVLADNMFLMFIGWEGVGLCSYLLISFWYTEKENAIAGNKAFIVNRIGDAGFLIGIFILFWAVRQGLAAAGTFDTEGLSILSFQFLEKNISLLNGIELYGASAATIICLCLFIGATGKSAQIPLYVWLPDAMAGPTPVSALIHAATMVTAGVYMIGRLNFLFAMSPLALGIIAATGAVTALFAATIGCAQFDIKKILAYSTISQLGYMFLGMGVSAYSAGIFHLMTHAFFKACLFLGAGSVIIGMHHEQDIRNMGGVRKYMPVTFAAFLIAMLSISGIPPLAGFFSKDEILWKTWESGHHILWLTGLATAGLTAFYMTRLLVLTFFGKNRGSKKDCAVHKIKESPFSMTMPLIVLALFSAAAGFLGLPEALGGFNRFEFFLSPVFGSHRGASHESMEYMLTAASAIVAVIGIFSGVFFYLVKPELPARIAKKIRPIYNLIYNKYFIDELYSFIFVSGTGIITAVLSAFDRYVIDLTVNLSGYILRLMAHIIDWFDRRAVDGIVNSAAGITLIAGAYLRKAQTGRLQAYVMLLIIALAIGVFYKAIF
ncbi:MAG: NADH-quinone oxidoreductase subunit L [Nitrospirae bacterium CG_4_10_14_3_um_filter_44_29]|nr:MAG: NADH-quinone oxidoreductase subunit L [Nitrospirae bacterium CG02_land_8_20_14_3_00_44_33]PIW90825.1 MAG: NADH-quinone oxidoreductase subunit L [Nitrospirae bacterium CG_4_8_14_3_um_filter_44_28]PIX89423.1 MAG: NADH-quinone oxidoreductase subunit L [Nitrospirae bacterium CG_4_10_14_3_um_filter_44_29]